MQIDETRKKKKKKDPAEGFLKHETQRGLSEGGASDVARFFISSPGGLDSFIPFHVCCFAASQSCVCSLNFLRVADEKKKAYLISTPSVHAETVSVVL